MIPSNIVDAIQAIRDGSLGIIDEIKIGDLLVSALTGLDAPESLLITNKPIQSGFALTDAAVDDLQPIVMTLVLANPNYSIDAAVQAAISGSVSQFTQTWRDKKKELYKMKDDREILTVQTHEEVYPSCMIQNITPLYSVEENYDAFVCSVVLERVDILGATDNSDNKLASAIQNVGEL